MSFKRLIKPVSDEIDLTSPQECRIVMMAPHAAVKLSLLQQYYLPETCIVTLDVLHARSAQDFARSLGESQTSMKASKRAYFGMPNSKFIIGTIWDPREVDPHNRDRNVASSFIDELFTSMSHKVQQ